MMARLFIALGFALVAGLLIILTIEEAQARSLTALECYKLQ